MSSLNESDKSTHLELLPVELQFQILTSIPNMKALRALLSASPRYFHVYRTYRDLVLSHVAWNHITPAVVPIALGALKRRDHSKDDSYYAKKQTLIQRTLIKGPLEIPLERWETLVRFHQIVDALISAFTSSRLVAVENALSYSETKTSSAAHKSPDDRGHQHLHLSLSQLEYSRLARAFYHLELYGSYIYKGHSQVHNQTTGILVRAFLQNLSGWELEELLCVRSYMIERLTGFLNKFEEDFMDLYVKEKKPKILRYWLTDSFLHNEDSQSGWIEGCLARGLEYLSALFDFAGGLKHKRVAIDLANRGYPWMSTVIDYIRPYSDEQIMAKMNELSEITFYNNIGQPNEAWSWAISSDVLRRTPISRTQPLIKLVYEDLCDTNDCERWGYVIWDHARLERLGILTRSPSDISAILGTDWVIKRIHVKEFGT